MEKYLKLGLLKHQNLLFGQDCGVHMFLPGVKGCCEVSPCTSSRDLSRPCLDQDLRIWVHSLWDAGQAVKGYVQLRVKVPKVEEMVLS